MLSARAGHPKPTPEPRQNQHAPVAQLDRASDYGSEGRGFESSPVHQARTPALAGVFLLVVQARVRGGAGL